MNTSFTTFMDSLIDYAGLFPPAALDISRAEEEYTSALQGPHGWMLGRFIISAARLQETRIGRSFPLSVLVPPDGASTDYAFLNRFRDNIEAVETTIPGNCLSRDRCLELIVRLHNHLKCAGIGDVKIFVESADFDTATSAIKTFNTSGRAMLASPQAGFKLRCGGMTASAFPSIKTVATAIILSRERSVPIKFTAGLHHPMRHVSTDFDIMQHGFLNIFFATLLFQGEVIEQDDIATCLADENPDNFIFTASGISWRDHHLPLESLNPLRQNRVISFGSCSFADPIDGLTRLGLLANDMKEAKA